jgi:centromere protein C
LATDCLFTDLRFFLDNEYTINNDYDQPARIFFAQGQEMPVNAPPEEDVAEDDDVDEEVEVSEGEEMESEEE